MIVLKGAKLATNVFWPGGHNTAREDFQKALKAIAIGLFLILSAYLIVKIGFNIIGYEGDPFAFQEKKIDTPSPDPRPTPTHS